jgi:hypothetical protein
LPGIEFVCARRLSRSMRNWGLYEDDGSRHFVSRRMSDDWGSASPLVADLDAGPYTYCHLGPMPWDRAHALVDTLRSRGARTISLDVYDRKLAGITLDDYLALVRGVDIFLPSMQDVAEFYPRLSALDALRKLRERLPDTLPSSASSAAAPGRSSTQPARPRSSAFRPHRTASSST